MRSDARRVAEPCLGVCQWFHYRDDASLERSVELLRELGVTHLRTGVSWADFHRPGGRAWYNRQMAALAEFDVLLSVWHTPPSIAEEPRCAAPPRRLDDFADFVWELIDTYGDRFDSIELWNEPNNKYKWDFLRLDPGWTKFARMIAGAAETASGLGKRTVLGGIIPVDPSWLAAMDHAAALDAIDVIAIHGFPNMWWPDQPCWDRAETWRGWPAKVDSIRPVAGDRPIWITETGLATCDPSTGRPARLDLQRRMLAEAAEAPADRVYWYSLVDLDPARPAIEGFHVDENEYHLGLVTWDGRRKPAFDTLLERLSGRTSITSRAPGRK